MLPLFAGVCLAALRNYISESGLIYAAAIAYAALISLFPVLLIMLVVISPFLQPPHDIDHLLNRFLGFPGVGDFLSRNMVAVYYHRTEMGATGVIGLLIGAVGVFGAIESALNRAWGVRGRRWIAAKLAIFASLFIFAIAFLGLLFLVGFGLRSLRDSPIGSSLPLPYGPSLLAFIAAPFVAFVLFFLAYKFLPNAFVATRPALGGAVLGALLTQATLLAMTWYIESIADYALYAAAGAVFALLTWSYALANVFLLGAYVSAELGRASAPTLHPVPTTQL